MEGNNKTIEPKYVPSPPDFNEGGREYRRNILFSTSLTAVLLLSTTLEPTVLGIKVPPHVMWGLLGIAHIYFFLMWRLTAVIEDDMEKRFWNLKGLWKQAIGGGRRNSTGKVKAQLLLIRALPIWAFIFGLVGITCGFLGSI